MKLGHKTIVLAAATLFASPAMAADLGGSYKDNNGYEAPAAGVLVNWTGFYVSGAVGASSTTTHTEAQRSDSHAVWSDTTNFAYATKDIYTYKTVDDAGNTQTHYTSKCGDHPECSIWKARGSAVSMTEIEQNAVADEDPNGMGSLIVNDSSVPGGNLGDAVMKNAPSSVNVSTDFTSAFGDVGSSGFMASLGLGYDIAIANKFVVGVMGDYQIRNASSNFGANSSFNQGGALNLDQDNAYFIGGRLGYVVAPRTMVYGTLGYTWLNHNDFASRAANAGMTTMGDVYGSKGHTVSYGDASFGGATVGGGVEVAVTSHIALGIDARHTWYGKETILSEGYKNPLETGNYDVRSGSVTAEPTEWQVMGTLKLKVNGDSFNPMK